MELRRSKEHREELPSNEAMKSKYYERKLLNENLSPLLRFLHRSVGRLWNDVYAEICAAVPKDSAVQRHVFQHLEQAVHKNVRLEDDGNVYTPDRSNPLYGKHTWYVHPDNGTLQRARVDWPYDRKAATKPVELGKDIIALKRDGAWFAVTLAPSNRIFDEDVWLRRPDHISIEEWWGYGYGQNKKLAHQLAAYGRSGVRAVAKRQLGKREIQKLGLR